MSYLQYKYITNTTLLCGQGGVLYVNLKYAYTVNLTKSAEEGGKQKGTSVPGNPNASQSISKGCPRYA